MPARTNPTKVSKRGARNLPYVHIKPEYPRIPAGHSLTLTALVDLPPGADSSKWYVLWHASNLGSFEAMEDVALESVQMGTRAVALARLGAPSEPGGDHFESEITWTSPVGEPRRCPVEALLYEHVDSAQDAKAELAQETWPKFEAHAAKANPHGSDKVTIVVTTAPPEPLAVAMKRAESPPTADQALWTMIRHTAHALSFGKYAEFMDSVLCQGDPLSDPADERTRQKVMARVQLPFRDVEAYRQLKAATEVFLMLNSGVKVDDPPLSGVRHRDESRRYYGAVQAGDIEDFWHQFREPLDGGGEHSVPYLAIIRRKLGDVAFIDDSTDEFAAECLGILMTKLTRPCFLELIWSYWHEEGMLVQTMNAITWRFQNRRGSGDRDPLALLEIDPLRPLNNFIWGYLQDEQHRLTVARRAYEYDHHYGLNLLGKAVPPVRGADSRSRFLEAFHNLLFLCSVFYKEDDDTTVVADGFPVLNALKEVHLLLTQGAHNQYGDLPWTARQEMLMQQWLLARPEFREFLPSRIMVDYPEPWMDRVETMKTLQGWSPASILHFRDLGVFGEQVLLGVRFGAWPSIIEPQSAANWARYWRAEIQGYIHAYRAVTGADMTERPSAALPSELLRQRMMPSRVAVRR